MGTPRQLTQIAFAAPLDESTEDEILDPTIGFPVLQNVRQDRRGGISKRLGFADDYGVDRIVGSDRTAGRRLFVHGSAPCVIDGEYLDTYSDTLTQWIAVGRIPECSYQIRPVPTLSSAPQVGDVATAGGYIAVVSQRDVFGQPTATILDAESGVVVRQPEDIGAVAGHVIISSYGTTFIACVCDYSTGEIKSYKLDTSADLATGWALVGTVVATSAGTLVLGALPSICGLTSSVALVYGTTSGTNRVTVALLTSAGTGVTTALSTSSATPDDLDIDGADVLWVTWGIEGGTNEAYAVALNTTTLASVGTAATVEDFATCSNLRICAGTTAQAARVFVHDTALGGNVDTADLAISAGAVVATTGTRIYNASPASRPLCIAGRYYMAFAPSPTDTDLSGNTAQALCVVADWTENIDTVRPVANVEPGLIPSISRYSKIIPLGSSKYAFVVQLLKSGSAAYQGFSQAQATIGLALVVLDFTDVNRWRTATHGDSTYIGGGILSTYDGARIVEAGFTSRPLAPTTDVTSGTGETIATGWRYVAIYEDVDAAGNWVVSGISNPSTITGAFTNKTSIVTVPPLSVTSRLVGGAEGSVRIALYRTTDGGAPPYYRLTAVANDPSDDLISYNDITPDATLRTYAKLYAPSLPSTPGSSLDRRAPPGLVHLVSYAGMLVGARGASLYWSGQPVYGEATWFSPVFQTPVSGATEITALAVQDGTLFIFTADGVWAVGGEIPADNGSSGGLGTPRRLAIDVGCIAASSVVVTSAGIFFQSRRGIEILTGGRATWIGEKVLRTLATYPYVTSAVIDAENNLVRFTLATSYNPNGSVTAPFTNESTGEIEDGGRDLVFDLTFNDWQSVDIRASHAAAQDAAIIGGRYAWLSSAGVVYNEADAYLDDGSWITMTAETGWFKISGIQGRQMFNRLLTLFRKHTPCDLSVEIGYEYRTAYDTASERTNAQLTAIEALSVPLQLRNDPNDDAEGQAIRVRIVDATPTTGTVGTGRGATWLAMTLDITPREGPAEVPEEAA